jgi:hypothetical protein
MLDPRVKILQYAIAASGRAFTPGASVAQVRAGYAELNRRFGLPDAGGVETERLAIPLRDADHFGKAPSEHQSSSPQRNSKHWRCICSSDLPADIGRGVPYLEQFHRLDDRPTTCKLTRM